MSSRAFVVLAFLVGGAACDPATTSSPGGAANDASATTDGAGPDGGSSNDGGSNGGDADADAGAVGVGDGGSAGCSMTIAGGVTASGPCNLSLGYLAAKSEMTFGVTLVAQPSNSFGAGLSANTTLTAGTYTTANVVHFNGNVLAIPKVWQLDNSMGSFTLTISDTGSPTPSGADTFYPQAHGTLDVTLGPMTVTGATGNTTMHVTF